MNTLQHVGSMYENHLGCGFPQCATELAFLNMAGV